MCGCRRYGRSDLGMMRRDQAHSLVRHVVKNLFVRLAYFVVLRLDVVALRMILYRVSGNVQDHRLLLQFSGTNLAVEIGSYRCVGRSAANQKRFRLPLHALEVAKLKLNPALAEHFQAALVELLAEFHYREIEVFRHRLPASSVECYVLTEIFVERCN